MIIEFQNKEGDTVVRDANAPVRLIADNNDILTLFHRSGAYELNFGGIWYRSEKGELMEIPRIDVPDPAPKETYNTLDMEKAYALGRKHEKDYQDKLKGIE